MRLACTLAVVAGLAFATPMAHAQPAMTAPVAPLPKTGAKVRSPERARTLSLAVPLVTMSAGVVLMSADHETVKAGAILFLGGGIVGPAAGHWYGGKVGGLGMMARGGAMAAMLGGALGFLVSIQYECGFDDDYEVCDAGSDRADRQARNYGLLSIAGLVGFAVSATYDVHAAGRVTESWNRRHALTLTPTMLSSARGPAAGAALSLRF